MRVWPAALAGTATAGVPGSRGRRRADVEWLRVVGMLLVFTVHAAEPFNPWDTWHVVSPTRSRWIGELVLLIAPWIMPLFMVLAGEGAWHGLARRAPRAYVRERLVRLGLPLAAGILLLVPPQVWLERRLRGQFHGSLLQFYPHFFEGIYPEGNFSWHHLWFLVFLLVFALVTVPLFQWLRRPAGARLLARLAAPCEGRLGLVLLVLPPVASRVALGLLVPTYLLAYDWPNRALLLPAFVFGFALEGEPALRRAVDRHWRAALAVGVAASAALGAWAYPGYLLARLPPPRSAGAVLLSTAYAATAVCWILGIRGAARRHVLRSSPGLERASELAYPFYVLHHPVIVAVGCAVVRWDPGLALAFGVLAASSLAITVTLCRAVSASGALRVVFGLRPALAPAPTPAPRAPA